MFLSLVGRDEVGISQFINVTRHRIRRALVHESIPAIRVPGLHCALPSLDLLILSLQMIQKDKTQGKNNTEAASAKRSHSEGNEEKIARV